MYYNNEKSIERDDEMTFIKRGSLLIESSPHKEGYLEFKINDEVIVEKPYQYRGHESTTKFLYQYIESEDYNKDLLEKGYKHYFKVFINARGPWDMEGYNLPGTFKTMKMAKEKIKELGNDLISYMIYEIYKKDKKIYNVVEVSPNKDGYIYLLPTYLREVYNTWKKTNNIILGLKTKKIPLIGNNLHYTIQQYEKLDDDAIHQIIFKETFLGERDESFWKDSWKYVDETYKVKPANSCVFYR